MPERIVIVEDDAFLREELVSIIAGAGFEVVALERFDDSYHAIVEAGPDLLVLDLNLPRTSGFELVRRLRAEEVTGAGQSGGPGHSGAGQSGGSGHSGAGHPGAEHPGTGRRTPLPILILTARDRLTDELHALDLGADDYLTKPVEAARLLARIQSLLRRSSTQVPSPMLDGLLDNLLEGPGFLLDPQTFALFVREPTSPPVAGKQDRRVSASLRLAPQEGRLLAALTKVLGVLVTKEALYETLWGTSEFVDENALMVTLTRLRKTLRTAGLSVRIETVRGEGLRLVSGKGPADKEDGASVQNA